MKLSSNELEQLYSWIEVLTGTCQSGRYRRDLLGSNVQNRMYQLGVSTLDAYQKIVESVPEERKTFLSLVTIHTTSWFREMPHYLVLEKKLDQFQKAGIKRPFRLWSAANSTGEEIYSAALVLEDFRLKNPGFEYECLGSDLDPVSLEKGKNAIYQASEIRNIPAKYHSSVLLGTGRTAGKMTLSKEIRKRVRFEQKNLKTIPVRQRENEFDWIFCRNVLIYFELKDAYRIVDHLVSYLGSTGTLCLGHSEALEKAPQGTQGLGSAVYQKGIEKTKVQIPKNTVFRPKVLVVDDSKAIRKVLVRLFESSQIDVVEASSSKEATLFTSKNQFDLITLDLHMPEEDGDVWLKRARKEGLRSPVIIVSDADPAESSAVLGALENGAQDFIVKSQLSHRSHELIDQVWQIASTHHEHQEDRVKVIPKREKKTVSHHVTPDVIVIGASTGGPDALCRLLKDLPLNLPPILVVQHINSLFGRPFAERLATTAGLRLGDGSEGLALEKGSIHLALDTYHIGVKRNAAGKLFLTRLGDQKVLGHVPAVDPLFESVSKFNDLSVLGILLTGMGKDGAQGLKKINAMPKSLCFIQDQESSVVYGMPGEAKRLGAYHLEGTVEEIRETMLGLFSGQSLKKVA